MDNWATVKLTPSTFIFLPFFNLIKGEYLYNIMVILSPCLFIGNSPIAPINRI